MPVEERPARRMSGAQRHQQLLDAARVLIREHGTDRFTLARLAERAGVSKPVVYDHFADRSAVFAALYQLFEHRQSVELEEGLATAGDDLTATAAVIAKAHIGCCVAEGREFADVIAALAGQPVLAQIRRNAENAYAGQVHGALARFHPSLDLVDVQALIGAGDALGRAVVADGLEADSATESLAHIIGATIAARRGLMAAW